MDEKRIVELMKTLDLTRDEAIELIQEDEKVDKMQSMKDVESDLTAEQKQAIKKAKGGAKAVDAFGKKRVVERKADNDKRELVKLLHETLCNYDNIASMEVTNQERQLDFKFNNRRFRIILSAPRK